MAKCLITKTRLDAETETLIPTIGGVFSYGIPGNWIGRAPENGGNAVEPMHNVAPCLTKADVHGVAFVPDTGQDQHLMTPHMQVRRLTPRECERLQGFRDDFTAIPYRNKPASECPDGPRYKALGNSMAVPVMAWIGKRIQQVEDIHQSTSCKKVANKL